MMNTTTLQPSRPGSILSAFCRRLRARGRSRHRVPVVLQMSDVECGAASLAMILGYHGRKTRVSECRNRCGVGRDGVTAADLLATAREYGLDARAFSAQPADFARLPLPAIAHWNGDHYVVIERWSPRQVAIVDPAVGRISLTPEEFAGSYTGLVLVFQPGERFERRSSTGEATWRSYLKRIVHVPGVRALLGRVLAASLVLQLMGLAVPLSTKLLVDNVIEAKRFSIFPLLGLGMAIMAVAELVTNYVRSRMLISLQARVDAPLMLGFFEHVLSLPFRFFNERTSGDLLMRLGSNSMIRETLTGQTMAIVLDGLLVVIYLALLVAQAPLFSLLVLAIGAAQITVLLGSTPPLHRLTQAHLAAEAKSQSYLVEALAGVATLKATGGEDRAMRRWSDLFRAEMNLSVRRGRLSAVVETAMGAVQSLSPLLLLWVGTTQVVHGRMSLGTMLALNALAASFLSPLCSLVGSGQTLQLIGAQLERIADVLDADPEQDATQVTPAPPLSGRVELRNVGFRYDANGPWVLRNVSLSVEPGQKIAIVGRTGSGKSTLAALLLGLHPPTEGEVLYDGLPLASLNYRSVRRQFGVVPQEPFLFSGSIRENVAFGSPELTRADVIEAARQAAIHEEVAQMPMTYETRVAEGGAGLSGGQRQRLSLARALASKPAFLLLDEATSHLDAVTEAQIEANLEALSCTRIVIAHRLSTIRNADLILVLDEGTVVERGTHAHLLARGGRYAALVRSQEAHGVGEGQEEGYDAIAA